MTDTATAANALVCYIGTSASPTYEVGGIDTANITLGRTVLDASIFKGGAFKRRILGLKDMPLVLSGNWVPGDTAQAAMKTAWGDGTSMYVQILPDGTNGFEIEYKVTDMEFPNEVDGKAQVTFTLASTGDVAFKP